MSPSPQPKESKSKTVLMIARAFPPFLPVGHSIRVVKFIKYLPSLGWLPMVLTIDDQHEYEFVRREGSESMLAEIQPWVKIVRTPAGEPSLDYLQKEKDFGQRNQIYGIIAALIRKVRSWVIRHLLLPDRQIVWLPHALKHGKKIIKSEKIDLIFSTSPPHTDALIGACLKKMTKTPLVLDFRDDWIDTPYFRSKPALIQTILRKMEKFAVGAADKVILVTESSKAAFIKRYPQLPQDRFILISNGCDLSEFDDLKSMKSAPDKSTFTIFHSGSLNDSVNFTRTPELLFEATRRILDESPGLEKNFTLAFTGYLPERLRQVQKNLGLSKIVKELGFLSRDDWLKWMKKSDLLLAINYERWSTIIPGKIYEYWAVGGPPILLISSFGAATNLIEKHHLGYSVDPNDADGIQDVIMSVYRQKLTGKPFQIKTDGIESFDRLVLTKRLAQVFSEII